MGTQRSGDGEEGGRERGWRALQSQRTSAACVSGMASRLACIACLLSCILSYASAAHDTTAFSRGAFTVTVGAITTFQRCSADTSMYVSLEMCQAACRAGVCSEAFELGGLDAAVALNGSGHSTTLSPSLRVTQELRVMVVATDGSDVELRADPGAPIGMMSTLSDDSKTLTMAWAPVAGLEGYVHEVHVGVPGGSAKIVIRIPVLAHALAWVAPVAALTHVRVDIGASATVPLHCISSYAAEIVVAGSGALPMGVVMTGGRRMRQTDAAGVVLPYPVVEGALTFTPVRGQEGWEATVCVKCHAFDVAGDAERCAMFHGNTCRYVSRAGDTLLTLSRAFHRDNNWRRLYNLNSLAASANQELPPGAVVLTGAAYEVQPGDSLSNIAARFHTTLRSILELNPSLGDAGIIGEGAMLCLAPCTSMGVPTLDAKYAY
ncbi:hypothetical protein T484DRAFT_1926404 [Baffinella frigidus]|nr:hypothetical protein T484DRAFT_1926404 [Cryptophyta sp. CCMP2293]